MLRVKMINHICDSTIRENPHCCSGIYNAGARNTQMQWNKFIRDSDLFGLWALANRNQQSRIFILLFFSPLCCVWFFCLPASLAGWLEMCACPAPEPLLSPALGNPGRNGSGAEQYLSYLTGNLTKSSGKCLYPINCDKGGTRRGRESSSGAIGYAGVSCPLPKWNLLGRL